VSPDLQVSVRLSPTPSTAAAARRFVEQACEQSGAGADVADTVALLVSEIVTNAIVHARTDIVLEVMVNAQRLRVHVTDGSTVGAVRQPAADLYAENGRGLQLVTALASDWGVLRTSTGKTVWFEVGMDPAGVPR
jgi:anti-sigma regulatory factor (Ser/Thr protein kinase)